MKKLLLMLALGGAGSAAHALPNAAEVIPTKGGAIRITPIFHGSLQIEYKGKVIQVDPFSAGDYTGAKQADYVLITHSHADHLDPKMIKALNRKGNVPVIMPTSVEADIKKFFPQAALLPLGNDDYLDMQAGSLTEPSSKLFKVEAVPAYNIKRGPKAGQKFHPKGHFNGYVLTLGGKRIYIAGDTEATPEMKALKNIDVAFLPMNLPYTMTPQEAAAGAKAFKPKVVYPYHYRYPFNKVNDNPQQFAKALAGTGIQVRLRGWYAHPAK